MFLDKPHAIFPVFIHCSTKVSTTLSFGRRATVDRRAATREKGFGKKYISIQHIESALPPKVYVFSSNRGAQIVFLKHHGRARLEGFFTIDNAAFVCCRSSPDQCPSNLICGPNSLYFELPPRCIPREGTGECEYSIFVSSVTVLKRIRTIREQGLFWPAVFGCITLFI